LETGSAAIRSTTAMPLPSTRANAVKPPFCASRSAALLAKLKNHWFVALLGSPGFLAIAIVPRTFVLPGSLTTAGRSGTFATNGVPESVTLKPPP
jgi:hypothetical protein